MSLTTGKIAEVLLESAKETYEHQMAMLKLVTKETPNAATLQNAGNVIWRPRQQHAPIIEGWDLSGQETGIIEETYPAILGTPKNDFVKQRVDDMRDMRFWERRGMQTGLRQATELNKLLASAIAIQGSLFYRFNRNGANGYEFIGEAQAMQNERQLMNNGRVFMMNDRDNLAFGSELAGRQTLQGRPEEVWAKGKIGQNVAEYDLYVGSFLPNLIGGASPGATVTGDQSFAPEAGSVNTTTGVVTDIDCRVAEIPISDSSSYNVGDKVTIGAVKAVGLADKTATNQLMTFTIVEIPDATTIKVYPKPIATDDAALSDLEKAYANVDTTISNADVVARLNIDATAKTNLFWDKEAIEVIGGTIPAELFSQFAGYKHVSDTMEDGQTMYVVYDGDIDTMTFRYRLFTWYGITVCAPENCGVTVTYSA
jgi:hypothetical protein